MRRSASYSSHDVAPRRLVGAAGEGVGGGDGGLQVVLGDHVAARRGLEKLEAAGDEPPVPAAPILPRQLGQVTGLVDPCREPGRVEGHQRGERLRRRSRRRGVLDQQRHQAHRLTAEVQADRRVGRGAVVALVEQEVERSLHGGEPGLEVPGAELEQRPGPGEHLLRPREPLLHRRERDEEGPGHLVGREAAQQRQDQRDLRVLGDVRMTAREHHPQLVVSERGRQVRHRRSGIRVRPLGIRLAADLRSESPGGAVPAQLADRAVARRGHQPGRGIVRHAPEGPHLHRHGERLLHGVLGERQVVDAEHPDQRRDEPARFAAEEVLVGERRGHICRMGRTSTIPP